MKEEWGGKVSKDQYNGNGWQRLNPFGNEWKNPTNKDYHRSHEVMGDEPLCLAFSFFFFFFFFFFPIINLNRDLNYQFWSRKGEKNLYKKRQTEKRLISFRIMVIWPRLLLLSASITTTLAISWQMRLKIEIYRTLIAFHPHSRTRIAALRGKQIDEWCRMWLTIANHS